MTGSAVAVATTAGCSWTATGASPWITITSGANGAGPGTVLFSVGANAGASRTGSMTVAGQTFSVTQAAAPPPPPPPQSCSYSINPTSASISAGGANNRKIDVETSNSCTWTATSNAPWITIRSGAAGKGDDEVEYDVAPNPGPARQGTLTVATRTFTVNQAGAQPPGPNCTYSINPTSQSIDKDGEQDKKIDVDTQSGCAWTAVSNQTWVTVTKGQVGVGDGDVRYDVSANAGPARQATLTVAGKTFTVTQEAGTFSNLVSSTQQRAISGGW